MKKETIFIEMSDGEKVALHKWVPEGNIKAVVQLSHGMTEYAQRYSDFAQFLCNNGFAFYAHDHRGHGDTATGGVTYDVVQTLDDKNKPVNDNLGYLADDNGFVRVMEDLHTMISICHKDFPNGKVILLGHSFGSFISQYFIENYGSEIDGCILSGTAGPRIALSKAGHFIAKLVIFFKGKRYRSTFLDNICFGSYTKKILHQKTSKDWLSRDESEVDTYIKNPLCGFLCTAGFFADLTGGLSIIHTKKNMEQIPTDLPVFFFAGDADPVGDYGKTIKKLVEIYKANGMKNVSLKLYPEGRHEMLNEFNKEEVMNDILSFIKGLTE